MPSSPVVPVRTGFLEHVQHSWPLAVIIGGLALYAAIALFSGRFYTNQGTVRRSDDPRRYWTWIARFLVLLLLCLVVLVGSYMLSGA